MISTLAAEPCFVDTNILVYAFGAGLEPRHAASRELLREVTARDTLRLSTQVLQELYATLVRQQIAPAAALSRIEQLARWPVFSPQFSDVRGACLLSQSARISYWDAMVVIAAGRMGATYLITEDLNHGQTIEGVRIVNPFRESVAG